MSNFTEHSERWHDEIAAYVLDALDEREVRTFEEHLDGCSECAERLRWMSPAVDVIPASVSQQAPPPELRERLMAIVNEEAGVAESPTRASAPADRKRRWLPSFDGFAMRPALAGAAAVLLLVAGVAGYGLRDESGGSDVQTFAAVSESSGSLASGSLEVDGDEGSLHVENLPPTQRGEVYQAWVQEPSGKEGGTIRPSSVFVVSDDGSGDVSIPHGLGGAAKVMVTREPEGGSEKPSENPVLTAELG